MEEIKDSHEDLSENKKAYMEHLRVKSSVNLRALLLSCGIPERDVLMGDEYFKKMFPKLESRIRKFICENDNCKIWSRGFTFVIDGNSSTEIEGQIIDSPLFRTKVLIKILSNGVVYSNYVAKENHTGIYIDCGDMLNRLQNHSTSLETVERLVSVNYLAISEMKPIVISGNAIEAVTARKIDSIIKKRRDYGKVTMLSFAESISDNHGSNMAYGDEIARIVEQFSNCDNFLYLKSKLCKINIGRGNINYG